MQNKDLFNIIKTLLRFYDIKTDDSVEIQRGKYVIKL